ncbi:MAG TPA: hypothetical protein VHD87_02750 [Acidimicrobiales bacterium]|nr:hypothetical protein [Acidimicrobiales bacterium]
MTDPDDVPVSDGEHDAPHTPVAAWPAAGDLAVLFETTPSGRHARLVLVAGEGGASELLACLESDHRVDADGWGFSGGDVANVAAHVGWHCATRTPPTCDDAELVAWDGDGYPRRR